MGDGRAGKGWGPGGQSTCWGLTTSWRQHPSPIRQALLPLKGRYTGCRSEGGSGVCGEGPGLRNHHERPHTAHLRERSCFRLT